MNEGKEKNPTQQQNGKMKEQTTHRGKRAANSFVYLTWPGECERFVHARAHIHSTTSLALFVPANAM